MIEFKNPKEKSEKIAKVIELLENDITTYTFNGFSSSGHITTQAPLSIGGGGGGMCGAGNGAGIAINLSPNNYTSNGIFIGGGGAQTITATNIFNGNGIYTATSAKYTYAILGTVVQVEYFDNITLVVSLINTLGVQFWDEYKFNIAFRYPVSFATIEEAMRSHRRDDKLENILAE